MKQVADVGLVCLLIPPCLPKTYRLFSDSLQVRGREITTPKTENPWLNVQETIYKRDFKLWVLKL